MSSERVRRKINDRLYEEDYGGSSPMRYPKEPELLWVIVSDVRLVSGHRLDSPYSETPNKIIDTRSIQGKGEIENARDIHIWGKTRGRTSFKDCEVSLHVADTGTASTGTLMHVEDEPGSKFKKSKPYLVLELQLPQQVFDAAWRELEGEEVEKFGVSAYVDSFAADVDRSLSEPWHHRAYAIESDSMNNARLGSISLARRPTLLSRPDKDDEKAAEPPAPDPMMLALQSQKIALERVAMTILSLRNTIAVVVGAIVVMILLTHWL